MTPQIVNPRVIKANEVNGDWAKSWLAQNGAGSGAYKIIPAGYRARHVAAFHAAMDSGRLAHGGAVARVEALTKSGGSLVLGLGVNTATNRIYAMLSSGPNSGLNVVDSATLAFTPIPGTAPATASRKA